MEKKGVETREGRDAANDHSVELNLSNCKEVQHYGNTSLETDDGNEQLNMSHVKVCMLSTNGVVYTISISNSRAEWKVDLLIPLSSRKNTAG